MLAIALYGASFVMSLGPLPTVLSSELFSNQQRGLCGSIALAVQWLGNAIVSFAFPITFKHLPQWLPFCFFCACCLLTLLFVMFFLPETKGVPLEKVEDLLSHQLVHIDQPCGGRKPGYSPLLLTNT